MLLMFNQFSVDESAHLESSQTSKVELFVNNSQQFSAFFNNNINNNVNFNIAIAIDIDFI